jgi:hypothetical protein
MLISPVKNIFLVSLMAFLSAGCNKSGVKSERPSGHEAERVISLEQYCSANQCRENTRISLLTDKGRIDQVLALYWPVVQGERISLLPGDEVFIEADLNEGRFINFKQVPVIVNPAKTIVFDFSQAEGELEMTLAVQNPFPEFIKFHLDMIDFEGNPHQTSSCPVIPRASLREIWPHPIPELIVSNMHALAGIEEMSCEY